jgi:SAM-dependent methyltransferase
MPRKPTWRRYLKLFIGDRHLSILRALEYEALADVNFSGRLLDFGGGAKSHYLSVLGRQLDACTYESVNISAEMQPTFLVEPGQPLPLASDSYDMVMAINTLEHVLAIEATIGELVSMVRPGGRIVFSTPFLFRMHGSPHDYNRPTATWWIAVLERLGLEDISVEPLMWDAFSTGLGVSEGAGPFRLLRRLLVPLYGLIYARLRASTSSSRYPSSVGVYMANFALGFLVQARKPK